MYSREGKDKGLSQHLLVFFGTIIALSGLLPIIICVTTAVTESPESSIWMLAVALIIISVGLFCILYPKGYRMRFVVGSLTSFMLASVLYIIYATFIPAMGESSKIPGVSIYIRSSMDFIFYEKLTLFLSIVFALIGFLLILIYVIKYHKEGHLGYKTTR